MNKEDFEKLPHQDKKDIMKFYFELLHKSIHTRMAILPTISALAATFLVVAIFNEKLLPLNGLLKFIISFLIILIPISLYLFNRDLKGEQYKYTEILDKWRGEKFESNKKFLDKITSWFPDFAIWSMLAIVIIVVTSILRGSPEFLTEGILDILKKLFGKWEGW